MDEQFDEQYLQEAAERESFFNMFERTGTYPM